ncbi:MAG: Ppx/GppA family phosphatase [Bryobacterales bacterium]|nr:Ppx/GppA family phosphatase [Bryobacterales bacterium]
MPRYAAIDIGSNSVRLLAAELRSGGPVNVLASDRQVIRLGESVFRDGRLSAAALDGLCEVLARWAGLLHGLDIAATRAVATSAVRDAANRDEFSRRAAAAIGTPVEIISGLEEARLIHLGVLTRFAHPANSMLILDVGGGSAEIIHSDRGECRDAFSKPLGAVRLAEVFLKSDPPAALELHRMEQYISEKLKPCLDRMGKRKFAHAIGTSATAGAIVCAVHRIPRAKREQAGGRRVTLQQIRRLYKDAVSRDVEALRKLPGVGPRRAEILIPGVAVFLRVLESFGVPSFEYSLGGVREGIVADLAARGAGRERAMLGREQRRVVEQMARKYGVCVPHARQVAALAMRLFELLEPLHCLPPQTATLLEAAAYLHDTGHFIGDTAHHRHSAYIVANSGMPGFTGRERELIAALCRFHRKSMPGPKHEQYHALPPPDQQTLLLLLPLLRLADSLDRSHSQQVESVDCALRANSVLIKVKSKSGADLDLWAAERAGDAFRQIYGRTLQLAGGAELS